MEDIVAIRTAELKQANAALQTEVAERCLIEEELTRARAQLMDAIESLDSGLVMFDAEERLVLCNQRYREIYAESAHLLKKASSTRRSCGRSAAQVATLIAV